MTFICFTTLNSAKLPLSTSRGTEQERFKKSRQLSKQLFEELNKTQEYTDEFILNSIAKILEPHKIKVLIEANKLKNTRGGHRNLLEILKQTNNQIDTAITGHVLCLNPNPKARDKYTVLHEAGHLFDAIMNPKSLRADYIKLFNKNEVYDSIQQIKNKIFYFSDIKTTEKFTQKTLKSIPNEYAIDALMNIRYRLKSEINQYKLGLKLMFKDKDIALEDLVNEILLYFRLKFNQKLKFTDKLLKNLLSESRKKL